MGRERDRKGGISVLDPQFVLIFTKPWKQLEPHKLAWDSPGLQGYIVCPRKFAPSGQ